MIDKSQFKVNERNGQYIVEFNVSGSIMDEIKASSLEEAQKKATYMCDNPEYVLGKGTFYDLTVSYVRKACPLYLVMRDGKMMQVSQIKEGDLPRDPDERGF